MAPPHFDKLFTKSRPHILEKICLSLDYESFKECFEVNEAWKGALTKEVFQSTAKSVFCEEILEDENKLQIHSEKGNTDEVRRLLSIGLLDPNKANGYGETPLYWAALFGHKDVVQLLLDGGVDPNQANNYPYPDWP